jgi:ribonuclease Z
MKENVKALGLEIGPWLKDLKDALYKEQDPDSEFEVLLDENKNLKKIFILGELSKKIALITRGQKITYIVDVVFNKSNIDKIIEFAKDSDHLYIEASFLHKDYAFAEKKFHLTSKQAGYLAAMAKAKQFTIFHFSPRNIGYEKHLYYEARQEYEKQTLG